MIKLDARGKIWCNLTVTDVQYASPRLDLEARSVDSNWLILSNTQSHPWLEILRAEPERGNMYWG